MWKPVLDVLALQLWPAILESRRSVKAAAAAPSSVILLGAPQGKQAVQGLTASGLAGFEFQAEQYQPNPTPEAGQKRRPGRPRKVLSLPAACREHSHAPS